MYLTWSRFNASACKSGGPGAYIHTCRETNYTVSRSTYLWDCTGSTQQSIGTNSTQEKSCCQPKSHCLRLFPLQLYKFIKGVQVIPVSARRGQRDIIYGIKNDNKNNLYNSPWQSVAVNILRLLGQIVFLMLAVFNL